MKDLIKRILREEKNKLFIPRKLSDDDSRYSEWNNSQPMVDGIKVNQYDSEGRKQGVWVNYFNTGELWFKGNFKDGVKDGYWESYYDNGSLLAKGNFKNGEKDGFWYEYFRQGGLMNKNFFDNGQIIKDITESEDKKKLFIPRKIDEREVEFEKMVKSGSDKFLIDNDIKSLKYVVKVDELWDDLEYDDIDNAIWDNEDCEVIFNNGEKWVNSGGWRRISHSDFIDYSHTISGYLSYLMSQHNPEDSVLDDLEVEVDSVVGKIEIDGIFTTNINKKTKVVNFSKTI